MLAAHKPVKKSTGRNSSSANGAQTHPEAGHIVYCQWMAHRPAFFARTSKIKTDQNRRCPSNAESEVLNWNSTQFIKGRQLAGGLNLFAWPDTSKNFSYFRNRKWIIQSAIARESVVAAGAPSSSNARSALLLGKD